ncbi:hypothetical protein GCM10011365_15030 [Marinicella pacifica]|uniref:Transmembrane protein n=1 Tax=Marinicella pacifica TaxID=1171543 RepID=A0A917FQC7_9GAMM|nr:hypothetical protein [Marinicella pacifica]GGF94713.1 hypothetical protein GCM10011365_15030 [Marinicella pacifica]
MSVIKPAVSYFFWVFLCGFVLGVVREVWMLQWLSQRNAELMEMPVILFVDWLSALYCVVRPSKKRRGSHFLLVGLLALILMLGFELTVVLGLRGLTFSAYVESRDVVSGGVYVLSLMLFMLMPWLVFAMNQRNQS